MIDYQDKVALVTGAASGIGAAIAAALAARGAHVLCADRDLEGAQAVAKALGGKAQALHCDLSDPTAAAQLIDKAYGLCKHLSLVVSNAGVGRAKRVIKARYDDELAAMFEINLFAGPKLAQAYHQRLEASGQRGRLMVTGSENSLSVPQAVQQSALGYYGATKHGLLVAMEWLRIEQQGGLLDLHVLMPGAVYTPLIAAKLPDPALAPPELELIMPEQCAAIALKGMDLGLFYIPTQAHILEDMQPRLDGVAQALAALGIERAG
jgi:NAD(P)-dependent dehydrogenase (short-subunit alcohol dehydrogenase family)